MFLFYIELTQVDGIPNNSITLIGGWVINN